MAKLVPFGLTPKDRPTKRARFNSLELNRVFYYKGSWYQKRTKRTARRADCDDDGTTYFQLGAMVYALVEQSETQPAVEGLSFEEFLNQQLL
jgi:hypothetical protein